jgi:anti-anti-sigma factor
MQVGSTRLGGRVETVDVEGAAQIRIHGECDISTMATLEAQARELLEGGDTRIIFDLEDATFIDSSILRVFLAAHRRLAPLGGEVVLLARPGFVRRLLHLLEIDRIIRVCTPEEWREQTAAVH